MDYARIHSLTCYLLPGRARRCLSEYESHYNAAYQFWRDALTEGFLSEGLKDKAENLHSDDFIRQEEAAALFYGNQAVGLFMFDWFNLSYSVSLDHSYFKNYPETVINYLKKNAHTNVMAMSHLCVHPQWRKSEIGSGVSEILVGLAISIKNRPI